MTSLLDQEVIHENVAQACIKLKTDLTDVYEQVRIWTLDIPKTDLLMITGTYFSNIMQIRDCNAPATFQWLMTSIFWDVIGHWMHVYLDNIFVYSDSIGDYEKHLGVVFKRLCQNKLYLKWKKCELYAKCIECLSHIIDDQGIHPDVAKLKRIQEWHLPRTYNDIQWFVGLVNYISNFLPDISAYMGPLMAIMQNGLPFQ